MGPKTVDLDKTDDINALKVMAYDQMAAKQQAETNLNNINTRIAQLLSGTPSPGPKGDPKQIDVKEESDNDTTAEPEDTSAPE